MHFGRFKFGSIQIDGTTYEHDVVIEGGTIRKRKKKPSKSFRSTFGHTPLSNAEDIPWACRRLVVGTGANPPCRLWRTSSARRRRAAPGLADRSHWRTVRGRPRGRYRGGGRYRLGR